jgi:hypothetical protein
MRRNLLNNCTQTHRAKSEQTCRQKAYKVAEQMRTKLWSKKRTNTPSKKHANLPNKCAQSCRVKSEETCRVITRKHNEQKADKHTHTFGWIVYNDLPFFRGHLSLHRWDSNVLVWLISITGIPLSKSIAGNLNIYRSVISSCICLFQ